MRGLRAQSQPQLERLCDLPALTSPQRGWPLLLERL